MMTRRPVALASMGALFVVVSGIFVYNGTAVTGQAQSALLSNTAGRVRSEVERYVADVTLVASGQPADPAATLASIREVVPRLSEGGPVPALQGDGTVDLELPEQSPALRAKLDQQARLLERLGAWGELVLSGPRSGDRFDARLLQLRVVAAQLASVSSDIDGQISADNDEALRRVNAVQLLLGLACALAAVAVGRSFMSAGRRLESDRYRALAHHSTDLVLVADPEDLTVRYVSPSAGSVLGRTPVTLEHTSLIDQIHPADRELVLAAMSELRARPDLPVVTEYRMRHGDGHWCVMETGWSNLAADRAVGGLVANGRDISDRKTLEDELRHKALSDDLTGLPNRALFRDRVEHAVERARRGAGPVTVMFVDLDDFKTVNDSLGHNVGDELLAAVAARLAASVRAADTVARLGGDEFGVLLSEGGTELAESLAERLLGSLRDPLEIAGSSLEMSASIGIACRDIPDVDAESLLRDADVAMYVAKAQGKGRTEVFAPRMHEAVVERQSLGADLQRALRGGQLSVVYQPLVQLETGSLVGVEALLRWNHPERGSIPPLAFIPLAEENGSILEIGAWVLEQACEQLRDWTSRHPAVADLSVTVNISPHQLTASSLNDDVRRALVRSGIRPDRLVLEITESAVIGDAAAVVERLLQLRNLGVRIAIDDFGTGYSSLSQLRQLPVDMLKIDKSFVDDVADGAQGRALLRSIVDLGRVLDLEILAEGIEDVEQARELAESHAHLGQGYLFARPAQPGDLESMMASGCVEKSWGGVTAVHSGAGAVPPT